MTLRDNILIQADAVPADDLARVTEYLRTASMTDSLVSNFDEAVPDDRVEWVVNKKIRDTQEVALSDDISSRLHSIVKRGVEAFINPFYDIQVRDWEKEHILHYGVGGHYIPHVDAETLFKDEDDRDFWEKTLDRDLAIVYFLNDDFVGGELVFPDLAMTIAPRAGTLIAFPADHNYIHGVKPVMKGHRFTLVTWMRVQGMPTPEEINDAAMEEFNRAWPKPIDQPPRVRKRTKR